MGKYKGPIKQRLDRRAQARQTSYIPYRGLAATCGAAVAVTAMAALMVALARVA